MLVGIVAALELPVAQALLDVRTGHAQGGDAVDGVDGQAETVDFVLDGQSSRTCKAC